MFSFQYVSSWSYPNTSLSFCSPKTFPPAGKLFLKSFTQHSCSRATKEGGLGSGSTEGSTQERQGRGPSWCSQSAWPRCTARLPSCATWALSGLHRLPRGASGRSSPLKHRQDIWPTQFTMCRVCLRIQEAMKGPCKSV